MLPSEILQKAKDSLTSETWGKGVSAYWNDAPERTLAEVHAAFDKAIAAAKEAGQ